MACEILYLPQPSSNLLKPCISVCIGSTYRVPTLKGYLILTQAVSQDLSSTLGADVDFIMIGADVDPAIWAIVEVCIGIVSANLPTMRPTYNLVVRCHYCTSYETQCSRCEGSKAWAGVGDGECRPSGPAPHLELPIFATKRHKFSKSTSSDLESKTNAKSEPMVEIF